jgi:5'-nucleotidase
MNKSEFLKSFEADIFFDDQQQNIEDACAKVTSAHVPFGIKNRN